MGGLTECKEGWGRIGKGGEGREWTGEGSRGGMGAVRRGGQGRSTWETSSGSVPDRE